MHAILKQTGIVIEQGKAQSKQLRHTAIAVMLVITMVVQAGYYPCMQYIKLCSILSASASASAA